MQARRPRPRRSGHAPSAERHDLGAMDEARAPEGHELGLRVTPAAERGGPLPRPAQIEDELTRLDHRAVDDPDDGGRCLARGDRDHRVVEQREPHRVVSEQDRRPAEAEFAPACGGRCHRSARPSRARTRTWGDARRVSSEQLTQRHGHREIAVDGAVEPLDQPSRPSEPTAGLGHVAALHQRHPEPPRVQCGPFGIARLLVSLDGASCETHQRRGRVRSDLRPTRLVRDRRGRAARRGRRPGTARRRRPRPCGSYDAPRRRSRSFLVRVLGHGQPPSGERHGSHRVRRTP